MDIFRRQQSISINHIPPLPIPHRLEYPLGSWMHLVIVHRRLQDGGRPFPRSPGPLTWQPMRTQAIDPGASESTVTPADALRSSWFLLPCVLPFLTLPDKPTALFWATILAQQPVARSHGDVFFSCLLVLGTPPPLSPFFCPLLSSRGPSVGDATSSFSSPGVLLYLAASGMLAALSAFPWPSTLSHPLPLFRLGLPPRVAPFAAPAACSYSRPWALLVFFSSALYCFMSALIIHGSWSPCLWSAWCVYTPPGH